MRTRPAARIAALTMMVLAYAPAADAGIATPVVIAGGGSYPSTSPDLTTSGRNALELAFGGLTTLAPDYYGNLIASEPSTNRIVRVRENSEVRDDGNAPQSRTATVSAANFSSPGGVTGAPSKWLVADTGNHRIVSVSPIPTGAPVLVVGTGTAGYADDTDTAVASSATFTNPRQLARTNYGPSLGSFLVADEMTIRRVTLSETPTVERIGGNPAADQFADAPMNGDQATSVYLGGLQDVSNGSGGSFYFVRNGVVWYVQPGGAVFSKLSATTVHGLADGFLYAAGGSIKRARQILPIGTVDGNPTTIAALGDVDVLDLVVNEEGLFFATGSTIQLIPATSIVSGPGEGDVVRTSTVEFTYGSWDDEATFTCELDYQGQGICPDSFPVPLDGEHHFEVYATTDSNTLTDQTPHAARNFFVDTVAPSAPALTAPAAGDATTSARPAFSWSPSSDPQKDGYASGVDRYQLEIDGAVVATTAASACSSSCAATPSTPLSTGSHSWRVRALDEGGNTAVSGQRTLVVLGAPTANLTVAPDRTLVGREVTFDASASQSGGTPIVRYDWDLDGQPGYETESGTNPVVKRAYDAPQTLTVGVRVMNGGGLSSVALGTVTVTALSGPSGPIGISINEGAQYTRSPKVTLAAAWPAFAANLLVSNDGGFGAAQTFALNARVPWTLDSSGPERLPKTVYVRYVGGIQTSETYTDDIILDETPPVVKQAALVKEGGAGARASVAARRARAWTLRIRATDSNSGVARLQVTASKRKPGKLLRYKRKVKLRAKARPKFVRARDRAGNRSRWRKLR